MYYPGKWRINKYLKKIMKITFIIFYIQWKTAIKSSAFAMVPGIILLMFG